MEDAFSAGVARTDITPPPGIAHANWGAQTHERATGVDSPLHATALALGADELAVVVDLDVLQLWPDDARRIRSSAAEFAGVPVSHVRLSYTHTHSGPTLNRDTWAESGAEMIEPYLDLLEHQIAGVAWKAVREQVPARLAAGTANCDIAVNRRFRRPEDGEVIVGRNPEGPVDHDVGVLRIDAIGAGDGRPLATVLHYACHPITVGPDDDLMTPDYPGAAKETIEEATGSTCLFLQGAAGDVGPIRGVARGGIDEYRALGRRLGHVGSQAWLSLGDDFRRERYAETLPSGAPLAVYETEPVAPEPRSVRVHTTEVELPLRDLPAPGVARREYQDRADRLAEMRETDADEATIQRAGTEVRRAEIRAGVAERYAGRNVERLEVQIVAAGDDVALVAVPGEPFVEVQQEVKSRSPYEHTLFSGYSNAGIAYLPTADAYSEGGYEVDVTPFAPAAADRLIDAVVATLEELQF